MQACPSNPTQAKKYYYFQYLAPYPSSLTLCPPLRKTAPTVKGPWPMASEPDPDRLRDLEARLQKVKAQAPPPQTNTAKGFSQGEVAWRMVIELATGILLGSGIGYGLDVLFGTLPIFLIILSLFGFAAGIRTMLGTAKELGRKAEKAKDEGN
jgi:ATP synthase protein I